MKQKMAIETTKLKKSSQELKNYVLKELKDIHNDLSNKYQSLGHILTQDLRNSQKV